MITTIRYEINVIQEEARELVKKGIVSRNQPIYTLCQFIPPREWVYVERELEFNGYLLRDRIIDLLGREDWSED
ncbi:DUF4327 family protein [Phormidium sp. LEGE 05292]|uniref:DUF4327 family protein n=1 Tax=[Phormidium] sp. LEGE 05292 TaxID=767427 RepID=UPI00187E49B8|nr:DUF4327 family protein [Phormidium sp. LEGE 05292]MBE9228849.1 DUF4327 family protein [Phormidium sp. LEGE 05292]